MRTLPRLSGTGASDGQSGHYRADTELLRETLRIATATRAELEMLCLQQGISHQGLPTPTLRQALKQRIVR